MAKSFQSHIIEGFVGSVQAPRTLKMVNARNEMVEEKVVTFSLAINEKKDGSVVWYTIDCFGYLGNIVEQFVTKGTHVMVQGSRLRPDAWLDKSTGELRTALKLTADTLKLLGSPEDDDEKPAPTQPAKPPTQTTSKAKATAAKSTPLQEAKASAKPTAAKQQSARGAAKKLPF
jgi:single-stranded DNA-binding protein